MQGKERGQAAGGIGRGELLSLALGLCLNGAVLGGTIAPDVRGAMVSIVVGIWVWGGLLAYNQMFAGMTLHRALTYALGRAAGRIVLFALGVTFLGLAGVSSIWAVALWQALGQGGDAFRLYLLVFLLVGGVMAGAGAEALARVALLVVVPALVLMLGNLGLTLVGADWANLRPVMVAEWPEALCAGAWQGVLMFGGACVLPAYFAQVRAVKRRGGTVLLAGAAAWVVTFVVGMACRVVLGVTVVDFAVPLVQVFRLAEIGDWFGRFEVVGVGLLVILLEIRVAAAMWAASQILCGLWGILPPGGRQNVGPGAVVLVLMLAVGLWLVVLWGERYCGGWWELIARWERCVVWAMAAGCAVPWVAAGCGAWKWRREGRTVVLRHR